MPTTTPEGRHDVTDTDSSSPRLAFSEMVTRALHRAGRFPAETMIEHVIAVVATVTYTDGKPCSRVHRVYLNGAVVGYIERSILREALRQSEREADRDDRTG